MAVTRDDDIELKMCLSSSNETRISVNEDEDEAPRIQKEAFSIGTFLLFAALSFVGLTSVLGRFPSPVFVIQNGTSHFLAESQEGYYGDTILSIAIMLLASLASGFVANFCKMPPLLGMLVVGIVLRNVGNVSSSLYIESSTGIFIRKFAFLVILLRGGLGLDAQTLRKMKGACLRLALMPCTVEAVVVALAAKIILDMQLIFGFILGFILGAVSPAVVVPGMLAVRDRCPSVSTLVIAAASIDDVFAIAAFSLVFTAAMNLGEQSVWGIALTALRAPIEVFLGLIVGALGGLILCFLPSQRDPQRHFYRVALLIAMATAMMFGSIAAGAETVGPIAVLMAAFVAPFKWRCDLKEGEATTIEEVALSQMWDFCLQPLLFTLIGYQLDLSLLGPSLLLSGFCVMVIGLAVRLVVAFFAASGSGLNKEERLYVAISWLPKATVQAALAPTLLEAERLNPQMDSLRGVGTSILTIAVLSILITAPLGAFLMRFLATRLLHRRD